MSEMSPSHIRGKLGLVSYLHTGGGILGGSIAAGLFSIDTKHAYTIGWRYSLSYICVRTSYNIVPKLHHYVFIVVGCICISV